MDYTLEPLTDFTIFTTKRRKGSQFDSSWPRTLSDLEREVNHLRGRKVVLELACSADDIRKDGMLRASARLRHPGVRISFDSVHGRLSYTCDTYEAYPYSQSWQHNVRAVVKTLESLRAVERHGATQGAQYAGFKAIEAAGDGMTRAEAIEILADLHGIPVEHFNTDTAVLRSSWGRARRKSHPDHHAGNRDLWDQLEQVGRTLRFLP